MIDNSSRMAQAYGYIVCLIAVVVGIASIAGTVNSLFDYADPIHSDKYGRSGMSVTSYNSYKREYYSRQPAAPRPGPDNAAPAKGQVDSLPDATLRQMYQEDRTDHIDNTKFRALRSLVVSVLLLAVSIVLFSIHWKWLRRQSAQTA